MFPKKVFVTPAEVRGVLSALRVMDVRYALDNPKLYGITEFKKLRADKSTFVDLDEVLSGPLHNTTARHPLPDPAVFVQWCMKRGLGVKPVLCYDDASGGMGACRLWWMLDALGLEAYVLNGGIQSWVVEGLPTASGEQSAEMYDEPISEWKFNSTFAKSLSVDQVPPEARVVDARFAVRFNSTVRPVAMDVLPGHIPGSVNHPWPSNLDESGGLRRLQPEDVLRERMTASVGGADASKCVFTCASGVTACINIAVAEHLGFGKPYLYGGAWSEYAGLFRAHLLREAVERHGFCFTMKSKNLTTNPKATNESAVLELDGKDLPSFDAAPVDVQAAVAQLFVGESATIHLRSGQSHEISVKPKTQPQ